MAYGQFVSTWAGVDLRCKTCGHIAPVVVWPWVIVGVLLVYLYLIPSYTRSLLQRGLGWTSLLLLVLIPYTLITLLILGMLFLVALLTKLVMRVVLSRRKCSSCGKRRWEVINYGVKDFLLILGATN